MIRISLIIAAFILCLTGCTSVEPDPGNAPIPTGMPLEQDEQEDNLTEIIDADADIAEIKEAISDFEVCEWSEEWDARIDYSCMFPLYMTINVLESSTLEDTLEYVHQYVAPVVDGNRNCYGIIYIYLLRGEEWKIGRYSRFTTTISVDVVSNIEQYGILSEGEKVYLLELPQLGDDLGFLSVSSDGEKYVSILEKHPEISGTEEIMEELRTKTHPFGTESDG